MKLHHLAALVLLLAALPAFAGEKGKKAGILHQGNLERVDAAMQQILRSAREGAEKPQGLGLLRAAASPLGRKLQRGLIDLSPYEPRTTGAGRHVLWLHDGGRPDDYLRLEVWAFRPGDMTTPHGHSRSGFSWVGQGDALEIFYRGDGGREVRAAGFARRRLWNRSPISHDPQHLHHIHAIGAPSDGTGLTRTIHLYSGAFNPAAMDDLFDPADLARQNYRLR